MRKKLVIVSLFISLLGLFGLSSYSYSAGYNASNSNNQAETNINNSQTDKKESGNSDECKGIKLNTNVPFVGTCIVIYDAGEPVPVDGKTVVTQTTAFPVLMGGLTKILMTLILSISFLLVIVAGVMMIIGGAKQEYYTKGLKLLKVVITAIAVLGTSGIVLRLINPNFFGV